MSTPINRQRFLPAPSVEQFVEAKEENKERTLDFSYYETLIKIKAKYENTIFLLRVEDAFLCKAQDAQAIKSITTLQVVMFAENSCYIFPANELENVLPKLVKQKQFSVAICDGPIGNNKK